MHPGNPQHHPSRLQHSESDSHRSKRQYQPPITSFFAYRDLDSSDSECEFEPRHTTSAERGFGPSIRVQQQTDNHAHDTAARRTPRESIIPTVPDRVQADLLSVGMRVRKSVPEGYKTHKTSTIARPSIQTTLAVPNGGSSTAIMTITPQDAIPDDYQHQRELLPYCGLQKIGGFAEQPVTNVHLYGGSRAQNIFPLPAAAFTQPFSSQSSASSSLSTESLRPNPMNPYKRSWQDEDDKSASLKPDFFFKLPVKFSEEEIPVSPMSESPPPVSFPQAALRPFAQPKTRRGRAVDLGGMVVKDGNAMDMEIENAQQGERRILIGSPDDFDEADFLQPSGGMEVDMGGV